MNTQIHNSIIDDLNFLIKKKENYLESVDSLRQKKAIETEIRILKNTINAISDIELSLNELEYHQNKENEAIGKIFKAFEIIYQNANDKQLEYKISLAFHKPDFIISINEQIEKSKDNAKHSIILFTKLANSTINPHIKEQYLKLIQANNEFING